MHYEIFIAFIQNALNKLINKGFMKDYIQNVILVYGAAVGKLEWLEQVKVISGIFKIVRRWNKAENVGIKLICECLNHSNLGMVDIVDNI